jgi:hypothetical protein
MSFDFSEDESIPLETEWIQEFEKIVEERIYYPCEPMSSLCIYALFIENHSIIHVSTKQLSLVIEPQEGRGYRNLWEILDKNSKEPFWMNCIKEYTEFIGSEEELDKENKRLEKRAKQFSLSDVLLFNVDMNMGSDMEEGGVDYSTLGSCFRGYSVEEWNALGGVLDWNDSVFLFHSINAVYFVFREKPVVLMEVEDLVSGGNSISMEMPVSILVSPSSLRHSSSGGGGKTRKVRFGEDIDLVDDDDDEKEWEDSDSDSEWGRGKWMKNRKRNRRKTEKRKHVLSPALIRSLFAQI